VVGFELAVASSAPVTAAETATGFVRDVIMNRMVVNVATGEGNADATHKFLISALYRSEFA